MCKCSIVHVRNQVAQASSAFFSQRTYASSSTKRMSQNTPILKSAKRLVDLECFGPTAGRGAEGIYPFRRARKGVLFANKVALMETARKETFQRERKSKSYPWCSAVRCSVV